MTKTVKISGVTFELRDVTDKDYAEAVHIPENMNIRYVARVVKTEYPENPGLKLGTEYFLTYHYNIDLSDVIRLAAPVPGTPGVEDTSMELSDDVLDEIIKSGTPAPATLIYDAGNAEEAINALTANYEPQELKEFMQSFMRVLETMKNAGEDISIYKNAVKLLGHDLHVAPFKFWVTDWYFDDRNYALIVKALKAGEKYETEEV